MATLNGVKALLGTCALLALGACGSDGTVVGGASAAVAVVNGTATTDPASAAPAPVAVPAPTPSPAPAASPSTAAPAVNAAIPEQADPERKLLADQVFYTKGSFSAYAAPWCVLKTGKLSVGKDLVDTISLAPSTFPNDVVIRTSAPMADPTSFGCGVYGYHHVAYGNYDGGVPQTPVAPRQVRTITSFTSRLDVTSASEGGGQYNVLHEFYLTSAAGKEDAKVIEIGYFLHASASAAAFAATGTSVGTFDDPSDRRWEVRKAGTFVMLMPADGKDVGSTTLDVKALLAFLTGKGLLTGDEWFNGMAVGTEPVRGDATTVIRAWTVALS